MESLQNDRSGNLLNLATSDHLVNDHKHLVEIEDQVQLAEILEEHIQHLHQQVNQLDLDEVVVLLIEAKGKEETGVAAVHKFDVLV